MAVRHPRGAEEAVIRKIGLGFLEVWCWLEAKLGEFSWYARGN